MVFPPQKPERRAAERDEARIQGWIERDWPRIKRKASRRQAHLVFLDEVGFMLTPVVQRTWALCGQTPVLQDRQRRHGHLSAIGALSISPIRKRLNCYMHLHEESIGEAHVIAFLNDLQRHLRGDIVLIWDNLSAHHSAMVQDYLERHPRLIPEYLPPYAPELNPIEYGWAYLKTSPLANLCPRNTQELSDHVCAAVCEMPVDQARLRGFVKATGLPIRLDQGVRH